ncbi:MAG: hypothetical protein JNJ83_16805 [Verrucomicrobiaceae bacterium]|nr:hypothetical protein [Verrucomicrobiaceae bacterium]
MSDKKVIKLTPDMVRWIGTRFLDPLGRVFEYQGEFYRAVYPHRAGFFKSCWRRGVYQRLMDAGFLVQTTYDKDIEMEGYGPVMKHRRLPFLPKGGDLCRSQTLDYARTFLEMNLMLAEMDDGYGLIDSHVGNFGQQGCARPVWLDLGSIQALKVADIGLEEFKKLWWRPLKVVAERPELWRILRLTGQAGGLSAAEFTALCGQESTLATMDGGTIAQQRKAMLTLLLEELPKTLSAGETVWRNYHGDLITTPNEAEPRMAAILRLINEKRPRTLIDLACANGRISLCAARRGIEVLAADYDEGAIERCFESVKSLGENIQFSTANFDIVSKRQSPLVADMVLALAVTHHMSLSQYYPFDFIAERLASYTKQTLLTEFMPNGLGTTEKQEGLPEWYTQEHFAAAFRKHFKSVRVIETGDRGNHSPRILFCCETPLRTGL